MYFFEYGDKEITYLKSKDKILAKAIDEIGYINREVTPDLFAALVKSIVGQQISVKAAETVWNRMLVQFTEITPEKIVNTPLEHIQKLGITMRKATYIKEAAEKVLSGELNIEDLQHKSDDEVCKELSKLNGVGIWTAEMLMTFSMQRSNVISYDDLAIQRGLRMLYHHRKIDKKLFNKYKRRYSPYATVASLYLWAIAGGACEGMKDYAPKKKVK
ncbi:MAG: DNA-3-methyladenine glycosylase family protein [Bacillaceae bacterium]